MNPNNNLRIRAYFFLLPFFCSSILNALTQNAEIHDWRTLDRKIQSILKRENDLSQQKLDLEMAMNDASDNILLLKNSIKEKRLVVLHRIQYLNKNSGSDLIRFLMESSNPGELDRFIKYFSIQTKLDLDLLTQYKKDLYNLESERRKLSTRISKLNETQIKMKQEAESYNLALEKKNSLINQMRKRLKNDPKDWNRELLLAKKLNNIEKINFYESLLNKNIMDRKGQLASPTDFRVKFRFGPLKLSPQSPSLPLQGILFESPMGSMVKAIATGTIAWIGNIDGIGDTIILNHGRDFYSIYSRVQLSKINIGDIIEEGSPFTKVALNPSPLGTGLYFEIREQGKPTDPLRWILTKQESLTKDTVPWENIQ